MSLIGNVSTNVFFLFLFLKIFVASKLWQFFPFLRFLSQIYTREKNFRFFSQEHSQPVCQNSPQKLITGLNHCSLVWVIIQTMEPPMPFLIRFLRKIQTWSYLEMGSNSTQNIAQDQSSIGGWAVLVLYGLQTVKIEPLSKTI